MGIPDSVLPDLVEKVRSWIYWRTSGPTFLASGVEMVGKDCKLCSECRVNSTESWMKHQCEICARGLCKNCMQNIASGVINSRCCQFCVGLDAQQKNSQKNCVKVHPWDSPRRSSQPGSPDFGAEKVDGYSPHAISKRSVGSFLSHPSMVSFRLFPNRSDEEEEQNSSTHFFSASNEYYNYASDVETSSVSGRDEFCSFKSVGSSPSDSPSRIHITSERVGHPMNSDADSADDLTSFGDQNEKPLEPLDFENNGLIWFPPLPDVEDEGAGNSFFTCDDEDDYIGNSDSFASEFQMKEKHDGEQDKPLKAVINGHFRALVSQLLQGEGIKVDKDDSDEDWLHIVTSIAWRAANYLKPDTSKGGSMDPCDYVKIKCLASGSPTESILIRGVVCTKNIKHKRMNSQYKNARLLLLGGALEYQRLSNQLASLDTLLQQESEHMKIIVSKIEAYHPNVLLVEKTVSSRAQDYLLAKDISLVLNVKRPLLERIARCTGAVITPSIDKLSTTRVGHCELFHLEKVSEEHEVLNKKPSKTIMYFEGCPRRLGCTVLLKGSCHEELKKVKHVVQYAVFAAYHLYLETSFLADEGASLPRVTLKSSENYVHGTREEVTDNHQSILVSFSSRCVLSGTVCERSRLFRIQYYGCFDKPLGRYLQDHLFAQTSCCKSCKEPNEAHVLCYTHPQGNLTINVKRLPTSTLPGERDGKIWMWHRCLRCRPSGGVPPATRRIIMSDAAWGLSFGKFLELSFSNHATANRVASCGHSLQKDCLRFYGYGNMVAFFRYSPVDIHSVCLAPSILEFNGLAKHDWMRKEAMELSRKFELLYTEISTMLCSIEEKCSSSSSGICDSDKLVSYVTGLHDHLIKERNGYSDLLWSATNGSSEADQETVDILELNRVRHSLLIDSHVWDRRLYSLESLFENCATSKASDVDVLEASSTSYASVLSDKIDSAWTGEASRSLRKFISPARVYSFDSAARFQERLKKGLPPSKIHLSKLRSFHASGEYKSMLRDPVSYMQEMNLPSTKFSSLISSISLANEGARLMVPRNRKTNIVIAVYDNEPTSIISYAIASKDHEDWISGIQKRSPVASKLSGWQSFGSLDLDYMQYGSYGSEDPKSSPHFKVSFEDESSGENGRVKFFVTCYFAREFEALRKRCCPGELDFLCSLSRCSRWSAQGGKSNVYFARSMDERFIVKQVTKTELESFQEFAPAYFKYLTDSLTSCSPTCLAKILGIYQVTVKNIKSGKETKMDLMVMENLFYGKNISRVYDLKGSVRSRYNSDTAGRNKVLLDMNLVETLRTKPIFLGSKAKRRLERAVWNDTSFLASVDVMDYSLLVGVDEERKELVLGIIDFMRQYTWDKHLETWVKASGILGGPKNVSPTIVSPKQYKKRFRKAMTTYFLTVPDQWSS